jgi:hypothetical protein
METGMNLACEIIYKFWGKNLDSLFFLIKNVNGYSLCAFDNILKKKLVPSIL